TATVERLTAEDYRTMPDDGRRYQLVDGEIHMAPAPNSYHQEIIWNLSQILGSHLRQHPAGRIYLAPYDVYLSENDVVQPDLLFLAASRLSLRQEDGLHGAPDLVIEVLSPATSQLDKKAKRALYARTGVKEMWLVDPILQQIHLYDFARDPARAVRLIEDDESFESPLLPGLRVNAAEVFRR
ncbi:MAG: Uma2 family endonuclease, partial [Verrucomicrobia bacterium]|nr:Uma2 family endonuclease [Verrucomicrobiota bacterium]